MRNKMEETIEDGAIVFRQNGYELHIIENSAYMRHSCTHPDPINRALIEAEFKSGRCMFCGPLDIPEQMQALWYLYRWGNNKLSDGSA